MAKKEKPSIDERYAYLAQQYDLYRRANRAEKGKLLDEMEAATGLHRKSITRLIASRPARKKRRRERSSTYDAPVQEAICLAAESLGHPTGSGLAKVLMPTIDKLVASSRLTLTDEVRERLERISPSTVGRILRRRRSEGSRSE